VKRPPNLLEPPLHHFVATRREHRMKLEHASEAYHSSGISPAKTQLTDEELAPVSVGAQRRLIRTSITTLAAMSRQGSETRS
jgi:hypothetical protein